MLTPLQLKRAQVLYLKYVSRTLKPTIRESIAEAHRCALTEKRAAEDGTIKVSPGLLTELRSECSELAILLEHAE